MQGALRNTPPCVSSPSVCTLQVTLMSVGNVIVKDVSVNSDGTYSLKGVYNPDVSSMLTNAVLVRFPTVLCSQGDVKSTKKKLHWVAAKGKHVPTTVSCLCLSLLCFVFSLFLSLHAYTCVWLGVCAVRGVRPPADCEEDGEAA